VEFNDWCKLHKISCSQKRFTVSNLNMKGTKCYPLLNGKAANTRKVLAFLAERNVRIAEAQRTNIRIPSRSSMCGGVKSCVVVLPVFLCCVVCVCVCVCVCACVVFSLVLCTLLCGCCVCMCVLLAAGASTYLFRFQGHPLFVHSGFGCGCMVS
jgi:hypothetical protein